MRTISLELERIREHALRLLINWPEALGVPADHKTAALLLTLHRRITTALPANHEAARDGLRQLIRLLHETVARNEFDADALNSSGVDTRREDAPTMLTHLLRALRARGWETLGASTSTPAIEDFSDEPWCHHLRDADAAFQIQPHINGEACETTPYTRQRATPLVQTAVQSWGNGLAARLLAIVVELNFTRSKLQNMFDYAPGEGPAIADDESSGEGIAVVEAARGKLIHHVALSNGCVQRYQIVAPTAWNFHPRGIAAQALAHIPVHSGDDYAAQARAIICAIDPCVAYHLDISPHA